MTRRCSSLVLIAACAAACGDSGPVTDDVKGGSSGTQGERYGCIETSTKLPSLAESGLDAAEVQAIRDAFQASRSAELAWLDGSRTQVTGAFSNIEAFKVESRDDPNAAEEPPRAQCVDRVSLKLDVGLSTADGRLAESLQQVAFERDETGAWNASPHKAASELTGTYERQLKEPGVLTAVYFSLAVSAKSFAGSVSEETQNASERSLSASLAHWPSSER